MSYKLESFILHFIQHLCNPAILRRDAYVTAIYRLHLYDAECLTRNLRAFCTVICS